MNEEAMLDLVKELVFVKHTADWKTCDVAAQELLRQHAEIESLRAQLAARVPDGWKLVPVEPTDAMMQAAHHLDLSYMPGQEGADRAAIYRAMLSAAPSQQAPVAQGEPVAWKHDCAALLQNDVELWVERCPHCGKPKDTTPQQASEPMTDELVIQGFEQADIAPQDTQLSVFDEGVRFAERHHQIKGKQ